MKSTKCGPSPHSKNGLVASIVNFQTLMTSDTMKEFAGTIEQKGVAQLLQIEEVRLNYLGQLMIVQILCYKRFESFLVVQRVIIAHIIEMSRALKKRLFDRLSDIDDAEKQADIDAVVQSVFPMKMSNSRRMTLVQ